MHHNLTYCFDEVLEDDTGYVFSETEIQSESYQISTGAVILDGTSVGSGSNEARDATIGKDDGVFGAPKLDGFEFDTRGEWWIW